DSPGTTDSARTTDTPGTTDSARTTDTPGTTDSTHTSDTPNTADTADSSDTPNTADPSDASNSSDTSGADKVIGVIDVDVAASPATSPTPCATHPRAHRDSNAEGNGYRPGGRIVNGWIRIIRIVGRAVDHRRAIRRHIDHLWIRLLDHDHALGFHDLRLYDLLLVGFQVALLLCLLAHPLHRVHHVLLLRQECIAQVRRPLNVIGQALDQVGQTGHRRDAGVPGLLGDGGGEGLILQAGVLDQP